MEYVLLPAKIGYFLILSIPICLILLAIINLAQFKDFVMSFLRRIF